MRCPGSAGIVAGGNPMSVSVLFLTLIVLMALGFLFGRARSFAVVGGKASALHSLPGYYG